MYSFDNGHWSFGRTKCPCVNTTSIYENADVQVETYGGTVMHLTLVVDVQAHLPIFEDVGAETNSGEVLGFRPILAWVYVHHLHQVR